MRKTRLLSDLRPSFSAMELAARSTPASSGTSIPRILDNACCTFDPSSFAERQSIKHAMSFWVEEGLVIAPEVWIENCVKCSDSESPQQVQLITTDRPNRDRDTFHFQQDLNVVLQSQQMHQPAACYFNSEFLIKWGCQTILIMFIQFHNYRMSIELR